MPNKFLEMIINGLAPSIQAIIAEKVEEVLEKLYTHDSETHKATVQGLYIGLTQLQRVTGDTPTKLDDAAVDALVTAVEASADAEEVELPA